MTAQIFSFPGQPEPTTTITPEHYARVAQGIVANCSSYNLDPMVLAGAIVAATRKDGSLVLPAHAKVSVRIDRYSMGCSIDVRVVGCTQAELWNSAPYGGGRTAMRNEAGEKLNELMNAYKRDNSDTMTDYYDVNFSGSVSFS